MSTPWEDDVAEALRCAAMGTSDNWPATARVLAAELREVRSKLADELARELRRCPVCRVVALGVVTEPGKPTRYHHEAITHFAEVPSGFMEAAAPEVAPRA